MGPIRTALRLCASLATTLVLWAAFGLGLGLLKVVGRGAEPFRFRMTQRWARALAAILGLRVAVRGSPPRPPFLLVANHLGYLDVLVLLAHVDGAFIAKAEVARWPLVGWLCRSVDTLFVDRRSRRQIRQVNADVEARLARGRGVILFPEGTSSEGRTVLAFKSSLFEIAANTSWPIHWAALTYRLPAGQPSARERVCWWGDARFLGHLLRLLALPRVEAGLVFGEEPVRESDRKLLASKLWHSVHAAFEPVT